MFRFVLALAFAAAAAFAAGPAFNVSFPKERSATPLAGRLLLILSTDPSSEPRLQIDNTPKTQMLFGMDVDSLAPGQSARMDDTAWGYPVRSLSQIKPGEYYVQTILHRYETFHRGRRPHGPAAHGSR